MKRSPTSLAVLAITAVLAATTLSFGCIIERGSYGDGPDAAPPPDAEPAPPPEAPFLDWATGLGGAGLDWGRSVALVADGSSLVTGVFSGTAVVGLGEPGETTLIATAETDVFIARYDHAGALLWAKQAGGSLVDMSESVSAYQDGSSIITGYFSGTAVFGRGEAQETQLTSAGYADVFVARYNADGTLAWAKRAGGAQSDESVSASIAADDSVIVAGTFDRTAIFGAGEPGQIELTDASNSDVFLARYRGDGSLMWAIRPASSNTTLPTVSASSDGSSMLVGSFAGTVTFGAGQANETVLVSAGDDDAFIASYDPAGMLRWARRAGGPSATRPQTASVFADGSVVVAGYFSGTVNFSVGEPEQATLTGLGGIDVFVARYGADGGLQWVKHVGSKGREDVASVVALPDGSSVLVGDAERSLIFGLRQASGTWLTLWKRDDSTYVARLGPDGVAVRAKWVAGSDVLAADVLSDGSALLTGYFWGSSVFGRGEPRQTSVASQGNTDVYIVRLKP